ncbi:TIGR04149 family rSAM-modified RiPP [Flavobacterium sp. N502540]|uniref:TIGR04149 family rSAM-modified RiPP n=1 Tax=Flavobacterium sp. N502540 TaxID=2986838 RepID=UPI002225A560|nr:TIGR04149 family rSAM-modified RiPP [Flavobacterium sp. N502540]
MKNKKLNFENFKSNTLSKKEQKSIHGGDDSSTPIDNTIAGDPNRGNGKGSN